MCFKKWRYFRLFRFEKCIFEAKISFEKCRNTFNIRLKKCNKCELFVGKIATNYRLSFEGQMDVRTRNRMLISHQEMSS